MDPWTSVPWLVAVLLAARWLAQLALGALNAREARRHVGRIPEPLQGVIDDATHRRSIEYTIARERFHAVDATLASVVLAVALFSNLLPDAFAAWSARFGQSSASAGGFLFLVALALSISHWPLDWHDQFRLEERFGFNTMTPRLWWQDRLRGLAVALVLFYPLLVLLLHLAGRGGSSWWFHAWLFVVAFQVVLLVLAPLVILPLFNRLTPLPDGPLKDRLLDLARRAGFRAGGIQVMDGSKRSRHSNAFFTGLGRFRRIVLFDTLVEQLNPAELEAVLAHEIGHYRRHHVRFLLFASASATGLGLWMLGWLARQEGLYRAFDYPPGQLPVVFLLFGLASGAFAFWIAPFQNALSRRFEFEADAYAAGLLGTARPLISALRKLTEKNLANLFPHPLYSRVYYSHPTLLEREHALNAAFPADTTPPGSAGKPHGPVEN